MVKRGRRLLGSLRRIDWMRKSVAIGQTGMMQGGRKESRIE